MDIVMVTEECGPSVKARADSQIAALAATHLQKGFREQVGSLFAKSQDTAAECVKQAIKQ